MHKILKRLEHEVAKREEMRVYQLPLWPEPVRGTPNSFLRSALFPAIQGKNRRALKREVLASHRDIDIRFTGWQFCQADLDVWEQAAHLARSHPLGNHCEFAAHSFLKALGRKTGKSQHEWLKDVFARLTSGVIEITHDGYTYGGHLVDEFYRDEETGRNHLILNKKLLGLYDAGYTQIPWKARQQLGRKELSLWLFGYYSSHKRPFPITVKTLHTLSGTNLTIYKFRYNLTKKQGALDELIAIGFLSEWMIKDDKIYVEIKSNNNVHANT